MPHISCATAKARLIEAMPRPVALFSGLMNSACDWRTPKISANTSAAAAMIHHCLRSNRMQHLVDQSVQRGEARGARLPAEARLRLLPQGPRRLKGAAAFRSDPHRLAACIGAVADLDQASVGERLEVAGQRGAVGEQLLRELAQRRRGVLPQRVRKERVLRHRQAARREHLVVELGDPAGQAAQPEAGAGGGHAPDYTCNYTCAATPLCRPVPAAAPALRELRLGQLAARCAGPRRSALRGESASQDGFGARGFAVADHPQLGLAFGGRQLAHRRGEHLVLHDGADAFGVQKIPGMVYRREIERAVDSLQSSNSASHLAAQMKSFSDSPPTAWVEYSTRHLL